MPSSANDIAGQVIWSFNSPSQGKGEIRRLKKHTVKYGGKVETVNESGNDDAAGFVQSPGGFTISLEFHEQVGKSWPDWDKVRLGKEYVTLTRQVVGGRRTQYGPARVSTVDKDGDSEGAHTRSVEIMALTERDL